MGDTIVAIIIVIAAIIPVAGVINYAYYSVSTSADVSGQFNKYGDDVDQLIWDHMKYVNDNTSFRAKRLEDLPKPTPPQNVTIQIPSFAGADEIRMEVVKFEDILHASRRNVRAEVFMMRRQ